ncbi:MAG: DNA adenine methylase [Candidatus Obscuribacterales bacterium]
MNIRTGAQSIVTHGAVSVSEPQAPARDGADTDARARASATTLTQFRSPLRYPGGKQKAISQIARMFPASAREYREPMLGGGSVYPRPQCRTRAILLGQRQVHRTGRILAHCAR